MIRGFVLCKLKIQDLSRLPIANEQGISLSCMVRKIKLVLRFNRIVRNIKKNIKSLVNMYLLSKNKDSV